MSASPRLGRGLAALLGDAAPVDRERAVRSSLPITALEPGPFQPRGGMDPAALAELTESIRRQGVLQPILARPDPEDASRFQIIAGERRWRASQAAGLHEVPVLIRALSDTEAMAAALVENLQRQDLDAIEEADGYRRLLEEFGLTQDQLGGLVGKSRSHVSNTMRLLTLPGAVREQVQAGGLSAGHARALLNHPDPELAMRAVMAKGLNVRQTEAMLQRNLVAPPAPMPADPELTALERRMATATGLRTRITTQGSGGTVHITFRNLDQLDLIIDRLIPPAVVVSRRSDEDGPDDDGADDGGAEAES